MHGAGAAGEMVRNRLRGGKHEKLEVKAEGIM